VDSEDEVRAAIQRARTAQRDWCETSFTERRQVLKALLDYLLDHADEICEVIVRDSGKTRENAMVGEIWPVCEKLRWTIRHGEKHLRPERRSSGLFGHKKASVEFPPLGVIGVICPWNYPLQNILGPLIPALFAGNAAVVKASEWVAWSTGRFQQIFATVLRERGHSTDLVRIVNGYAETGAALVRGGVDEVIFTGSLANGRKILSQSADGVTPVILELGGKDALIVCDDADLEQAAHATLAGVFVASGQNCLAAERIVVFRGIYEAFESRMVDLVRNLRQGSPLGGEPVDVGAITSPVQLDLIERLVNDALAKGARALVGGRRALVGAGQYFEPTLLVDVTDEMDIAHQETFGPVMVLRRVTGEDAAIDLANATAFGLGCTIMTRDARRARRMQRRIVTGGVSINDFGLTYMAQSLPFGGVKGSGFGRLNGREGLRACTNLKAVLEDRLPFHQPARLYPVGQRDYDVARAAIRTAYGRGMARRLRGLRELWRSWH